MSQNIVVIGEGKTKIVKTNPNDPATVFLYFKDDITAGDGAKHDVFEGKAVLDWAVSRDCFELLSRRGLGTHYIDSPEERLMLVRKLDRKLELEVVTRRVATGSILTWGDYSEGDRFDPVITQFHYKDDPLHDSLPLFRTYGLLVLSTKVVILLSCASTTKACPGPFRIGLESGTTA